MTKDKTPPASKWSSDGFYVDISEEARKKLREEAKKVGLLVSIEDVIKGNRLAVVDLYDEIIKLNKKVDRVINAFGKMPKYEVKALVDWIKEKRKEELKPK